MDQEGHNESRESLGHLGLRMGLYEFGFVEWILSAGVKVDLDDVK